MPERSCTVLVAYAMHQSRHVQWQPNPFSVPNLSSRLVPDVAPDHLLVGEGELQSEWGSLCSFTVLYHIS
jgi:hypothetical protein